MATANAAMSFLVVRLRPHAWIRPQARGYRFGCCGCGLVHRVDFRVRDRRAEFRLHADSRATRWLRAHLDEGQA